MCVQLRSTNNYGLKHTHTQIYIYIYTRIKPCNTMYIYIYIISYVTNSALPSTTETSPNYLQTSKLLTAIVCLGIWLRLPFRHPTGTHRSGLDVGLAASTGCFSRLGDVSNSWEFLLKSWVKEHQHQKLAYNFSSQNKILNKQFRIDIIDPS